MTRFRTLALGPAVAAILGLTAPSAHAQGWVTFQGTVHIDCFGCGASSGAGELCVNGVVRGRVVVCVPGTLNDPNVNTAFVVFEDPAVCPVVGLAEGDTAGDVDVHFTWSRVGAFAVITTTGDINGAGVATFAVTAPIGNPCGIHNIEASVSGWVAGT